MMEKELSRLTRHLHEGKGAMDALAVELRHTPDLEAHIRKLPPRRQRVLVQYFGLDNQARWTMKQIGEQEGISASRVSQLIYRSVRDIAVSAGEFGGVPKGDLPACGGLTLRRHFPNVPAHLITREMVERAIRDGLLTTRGSASARGTIAPSTLKAIKEWCGAVESRCPTCHQIMPWGAGSMKPSP